uniref:Uncharacterized protein n=1 Tax=Myoviridae sp. ct4uh47 TaxID=2825032 RepID=A0A8S5V5S1_9CAUD|nr:MAG TPA: hypothetical protein [Myoviridae sp. ct4uh47]
MQGHVYMDVTQIACEEKTSIAVDCELKNVDVFDKFQLLDAMCRALHVRKQEWMLYVLLRDKEM